MPDKTPDLAVLATRGWVSLNRFAKIVGISYPTALKYKDEGKINTIQVGGTFRVYSDEVQRFLKEGTVNTSSGSNLRVLDQDDGGS